MNFLQATFHLFLASIFTRGITVVAINTQYVLDVDHCQVDPSKVPILNYFSSQSAIATQAYLTPVLIGMYLINAHIKFFLFGGF